MTLLAITIILQMIAGYFLGFFATFALGIGNGLELIVMPIGYTLAIYGVPFIMAQFTNSTKPSIHYLIMTAVGALLGIGLIIVSPATGFIQILYPMVGGLIGYYSTPYVLTKMLAK